MGIIEIPSFYDNKDIEPISIPLFYKNSTNPLNTSRQSEAISIPDFYEKGGIAVMSSCRTSLCGTAQACAGCMFSCQPGCQWNCEHRCEDNCEWACQSGCQDSCEVSCEDECEDSCQAYCMSWCMCYSEGCQDSCQDGCEYGCETSCEICQASCQDTCLNTCESCQSCEDECEWNCEDYCMTYCEDYCESSCETTCEKSCMDACEVNTQDPQPPAPDFVSFSNVTKDGVTIKWGSVTGSTWYHIYVDGDHWTSVRHPATTYRLEMNFKSSTKYTICVAAVRILNMGVKRCNSFTSPASVRPENWYWGTTTNSKGNTLYVVSADKWNQFTKRIDLFRDYVKAPNESYPYPYTKVAKNQTLTKEIFNEAIYAINPMLKKQGITQVALLTTHIRIPEDFIILREKLNLIE